MNCLIIDDDKVAQKAMQFLIARLPYLNLLGIYDEPMASLNALKEQQVDLIFLDIEMPGVSGLDFLKNFGDLPQVIVCSSKKEYAADVFEYSVTDYLVKPASYERFVKAVEKAKQNMAGAKPLSVNDDSFFIKTKGNYLNVHASDILYFEALSDYVTIHTQNSKYTIYSTMHAIESKISAKDFLRIHRSYIIRLDKIASLEEGRVFVKNVPLPVSKPYRRQLNNRLTFL